MSTPKTPAEVALDTLAQALAPRVARLLREAPQDDDATFVELLASAGFEIDHSDGAQPVPAFQAKPIVPRKNFRP